MSTQTFQALLASMNVAIFRGEPDLLSKGVIEKLGFRFSTVLFPEGGRHNHLLAGATDRGVTARTSSIGGN